MFDRYGKPCVIWDDTKIRDRHGKVIAWLSGDNVYSLKGDHIGWFDHGVIFDSTNSALAFSRNRTTGLPSVPGLSGTPGMPGFAGTPGRPGYSGTPGRPGSRGWSNQNPTAYLSA
ncbi:collagen-like triple helix repeat-containing protein [Giesbergeria giesbergeri]